MTDKTDPRLDAPGDPDARMNAYYYSFNRTGVGIIDAILSAVATAGKRYHHTESWADPWGEGERQQVELIQEAADAAAEAIRNHAADTESLRAECVRRQADWDDAAAEAATVVADAARSTAGIVRVDTNDEALAERITSVLADNGVQPNTDAMHSWRCNEPDRYPNYCTCVPELVGDLIAALREAS